MKKSLLIFLLILFSSINIFSASLFSSIIGLALEIASTERTVTIDLNGDSIDIKSRSIFSLKRNLNKLDFTEVSYLERLGIYDEAKLTYASPFFLNTLLGFGSGSKKQGDIWGYGFGRIIDSTIFIAAFIAATAPALVWFFAGIVTFGFGFMTPVTDLYPEGYFNQLLIIGAGSLGVSRIIQGSGSLIYSGLYNSRLRKNFGLDSKKQDVFNLEINPVPVETNFDEQKLGLNIRFSFVL